MNSSSSKKVVVIGAGISGLTSAYLLTKKGFDITVLEKKADVGGSIETVVENGFLFDRGPNSALETTPIIAQLVEELNLKDELLYANKEANKRYILRDGVLNPLPMNPKDFITSKLFSTKAKLRLFLEPFISRSNDGYYQSVAEFVTRRLGKEFLDYAINPFVAGVYAGRPEDLSVKSAFPKLYALEEEYGGIFIGTIRSIRKRKKRAEKSKQSAKMISFRNGMITLPKAIANSLGEKVITNANVRSIIKSGDKYKVTYDINNSTEEISCDGILSTVPAFVAGNLLSNFDAKIKYHCDAIYYPPVLVYFLAYEKKSIGQTLDGFGFLIPEKEKKSFLGALWSSIIFPNRAGENFATFTLFIGGSRNPNFVNEDKDKLLNNVRKEFEEIMKINGEPVYSSHRFWEKAIPQYNLGYIEHERFFEEFEKQNPGLFISGNFRGGISVGDCIKNAELVAEKIFVNV
ncbi:MAG: protoporphyrinogen oxidase [Ignavibacterium sp.]|nr:protoporphyrinogen oxidase [Ignavibacterium sp.]